MNNKVLIITRTAVFIAMLLIFQISTAVFGNTLITGSLVNLVLIVAVVSTGLTSGLTVAIISPFFAKLIGIGPLWTLIPFIALGNAVLVVAWYVVCKFFTHKKKLSYIIATPIAASLKFLTLYISIVKLAIPLLLSLPEKQASTISGIFSVPQLFTALIGGAVAVLIIPNIVKVTKK